APSAQQASLPSTEPAATSGGVFAWEPAAIVNDQFGRHSTGASGGRNAVKRRYDMKKRIAIVGSILVVAALAVVPLVYAQGHRGMAGHHGGAAGFGFFG